MSCGKPQEGSYHEHLVYMSSRTCWWLEYICQQLCAAPSWHQVLTAAFMRPVVLAWYGTAS